MIGLALIAFLVVAFLLSKIRGLFIHDRASIKIGSVEYKSEKSDYMEDAKWYISRKEYSKALGSLDREIKLICNNEGAFLLRAICLQHLSYHYEAIDDLNSALELNPVDCNYYHLRASSKSRVTDFQGQIDDLKLANRYYKEENSYNENYNELSTESALRFGIILKTQLIAAETKLRQLISKKDRIEKAISAEARTLCQEDYDTFIKSHISEINKRPNIKSRSFEDYCEGKFSLSAQELALRIKAKMQRPSMNRITEAIPEIVKLVPDITAKRVAESIKISYDINLDVEWVKEIMEKSNPKENSN